MNLPCAANQSSLAAVLGLRRGLAWLRGVMVGGGPTKLSLLDKAGDTTRWVEIGQTFAGYTVKAYDPAKETVTLLKDGKELRLRLNASQISDVPADASAAAPTAGTAKISYETARKIFNNLRQIAAASDQYYLENGKNTVTLDELIGPTKYIKQLNPEAGENYGALKLSAGNELFSVMTASGERITWDGGGKGSSFYSVRPGDTLVQIAQKTGSTLVQLIDLNGIDNPTSVKVGQMLRVK